MNIIFEWRKLSMRLVNCESFIIFTIIIIIIQGV